ncbi:MAG: hypothetical protein O8C66_06810 [Candidatus Methanoperedens sp.]|nr:hypothetical protein [Candidatus Methanoperedens sp.]
MTERIINKIIKIISIVFFILLSYALYVIYRSPAEGNELSIYTPYINVWIILLSGMVFSLFSLEYIVSIKKNTPNRYIVSLLLLLIIWIILIMPQLRGYALYGRDDSNTHLGIVIDIIKYGHLGEEVYPIIHLIIVTITYFTDIEAQTIIQYMGPLFSMFSLLFIYALSYYIFKDAGKSIFIVAISVFPIANIESTPNRLAELTIPIVLLLYIKYKYEPRVSISALLIIFTILYPLYHPISSLLLILSFLGSDIINFVLKQSKLNFNSSNCCKWSILPLISLVIIFLWFWNHYSFWDYNIGNVIRWFGGEIINSGSRTKEVLTLFDKYHINFFELLIKVWSHQIVYISISALAIFMMFERIIRPNKNRKFDITVIEKLVLSSSWIIIPMILAVGLMFVPSTASPDRMLRYVGILSTIFVGWFFFDIRKKPVRMLLLMFIVVLMVNSALVIHPSPYIHVPNSQVTKMEFDGMAWFFEHRNQGIEIKNIFERYFRFADAMLGIKATSSSNLIGNYYDQQILDHFGYDNYTKIGDSNHNTFYLLLGKFDESVHLHMFNAVNAFNSGDFDKIYNYDSSANKIYSNNEFTVFLINQQKVAKSTLT